MKKTRLIAMLLVVASLFSVVTPMASAADGGIIYPPVTVDAGDEIKDPTYVGETNYEDPIEVDYGITSRYACDHIYYVEHTDWDDSHTDTEYYLAPTCTTAGYEIRTCDCGVNIYVHYGEGTEDEAYDKAEDYINPLESDSTEIIMTHDEAYDVGGHEYEYLAEAWIDGQQWLVYECSDCGHRGICYPGDEYGWHYGDAEIMDIDTLQEWAEFMNTTSYSYEELYGILTKHPLETDAYGNKYVVVDHDYCLPTSGHNVSCDCCWCGYVHEEGIDCGHTICIDKQTVAPTCTEQGYDVWTTYCAECGETLDTIVRNYTEPTGHDWAYNGEKGCYVCKSCGVIGMIAPIDSNTGVLYIVDDASSYASAGLSYEEAQELIKKVYEEGYCDCEHKNASIIDTYIVDDGDYNLVTYTYLCTDCHLVYTSTELKAKSQDECPHNAAVLYYEGEKWDGEDIICVDYYRCNSCGKKWEDTYVCQHTDYTVERREENIAGPHDIIIHEERRCNRCGYSYLVDWEEEYECPHTNRTVTDSRVTDHGSLYVYDRKYTCSDCGISWWEQEFIKKDDAEAEIEAIDTYEDEEADNGIIYPPVTADAGDSWIVEQNEYGKYMIDRFDENGEWVDGFVTDDANKAAEYEAMNDSDSEIIYPPVLADLPTE